MEKYTQSLRNKKRLFFVISSLLWLGTLAFLAIYGIATKPPQISDESFTVKYGTVTVTILLSTVIIFVMFLLIKEKLRSTVWMGSLVYSMYLFGTTGAYVVLAIWAVDEYVIKNLYGHYKNRYVINKEIDRRNN